MPNIKLTYFDGRGRCEHIRLILAYGGIKYEDVRVQFPDWPALKPCKLLFNIFFIDII